MQHVITDDLEALLATLPPDIHDAVNRLDNRSELLEIVLDLGRLAEGRFPEGEVILSKSPVTYADLEYVVERIGEFGDDNRAGIESPLRARAVSAADASSCDSGWRARTHPCGAAVEQA